MLLGYKILNKFFCRKKQIFNIKTCVFTTRKSKKMLENCGFYDFINSVGKIITVELYYFKSELFINGSLYGDKLNLNTYIKNDTFKKYCNNLFIEYGKTIFFNFKIVLYILSKNNIKFSIKICIELENAMKNTYQFSFLNYDKNFAFIKNFKCLSGREIGLFFYKPNTEPYFLICQLYEFNLKENKKLLNFFNKKLQANKNQLTIQDKFVRASIGLHMIFQGSGSDLEASMQFLKLYVENIYDTNYNQGKLFYNSVDKKSYAGVNHYPFITKSNKIVYKQVISYRGEFFVNIKDLRYTFYFDIGHIIKYNFQIYNYFFIYFQNSFFFETRAGTFYNLKFVLLILTKDNIKFSKKICSELELGLKGLPKINYLLPVDNDFLYLRTIDGAFFLQEPINLFICTKNNSLYFPIIECIDTVSKKNYNFYEWELKNKRLLEHFNQEPEFKTNQFILKNKYIIARVGLHIIFQHSNFDLQIKFLIFYEEWLINNYFIPIKSKPILIE